MNYISSFPTPTRRALLTDDPETILTFAQSSLSSGKAAIATLVEIRGGASRSLGAQVAVAADGGYVGYVSGGCVEAAVACEALLAMEEQIDRLSLFGAGSPHFDIVLPCGGGITVLTHVLHDEEVVNNTLCRLRSRQSAGIRHQGLGRPLVAVADPGQPFTTDEEGFVVRYQPKTRLLISGNSLESTIVGSLATASGYDVVPVSGRAKDEIAEYIDPYTAIVSLHHDLDAEDRLLDIALRSTAFYIGALGSSRTHRARCERLTARGHSEESIRRIRAPIGLFGPARDASTLAISVLAEVASERLRAVR
ncbi:XdhC family protein [Rhizobium leguminosarum]|uniref:XdhC family protein n=1 Tax=Rhizobium leguminosarum TaxID=384 RepID=UPI003F9D619F